MASSTQWGIRIISALTAGCLLLACNARKSKIQYPIDVNYSVSSPDTGALALVNTYYAERFSYTMYDTIRISSEREALLGNFKTWYDRENLFIRESNGRFCKCSHLTGDLLKLWDESYEQPYMKFGDDSRKRGGEDVIDGFFVREGDTTWVAVNPKYPNMWFEFPDFPGLPVEFSYKLRDAPVLYSADNIEPSERSFDTNLFDENCVRVPAQAYLGFGIEDDIVDPPYVVWLHGQLLDDDEQALDGSVTVQSTRQGVTQRAVMQTEYGGFDLELLQGYEYIIEFTAPGMVKKRADIDCSKLPEDYSGRVLGLSVKLFESSSLDLRRFLEQTAAIKAEYDPEEELLKIDDAYTKQIADDIMRMRSRETGVRP